VTFTVAFLAVVFFAGIFILPFVLLAHVYFISCKNKIPAENFHKKTSANLQMFLTLLKQTIT
jgi:Ni,Fe-hydrogenase I cytochrome b subunit